MPKAYFDRDHITLQEGNHVGAKIGGKLIEPDESEYVTGEVEQVIIYKSANSPVELKCTRDVRFEPGEEVILQQLDPVSYAAIGMKSGKEVEFKE
ncbi:hypothetical protein Asppvi_005830 [Aspergillus pseudoviridinutans]|uniref:Uncharacterized protein n=1 Tax=Aspergillus pseudoviridinutans TaxID=1517512 RepID=A0A9P3BFS5_9EURO|nr:uncharacterized protein Asppvi_005830 [Aspergillus pseudoviridinutans]GIJ86931.1 hypothetical protein Asppvi_005830 [Aspergillus pseudoviridinutans]